MLKSAILLAAAALVNAQSGSSDQPCASVASILARSSTLPIPAKTAFDCLNSVPIDVQGNADLIDELKQVWQFQSELVWFKNPGDDWEYGPLDIIGELDRIKRDLTSFQSEYEVQLAIQNITVRTGNFHFNYAPDILQVFQFQRPINVASISSDGKELPKLYVYDDVARLASGSNRVSEIQQINGQNPYNYLKSTFFSQYIDSDGQMNNMFATGDTDNNGAFALQRKYDGNSTELSFANDTTASISNLATTEFDFEGITDGESFFNAFCTGRFTGASAGLADTKDKESGVITPNAGVISPSILGQPHTIPNHDYHTRNKRQSIPRGGYPQAVAESDSGVVSGYFLAEEGYEDVAVLKIISFSNPGTSGETLFNNDFQITIESFLVQCQSLGKTKLIIDLRENGGGNTNLLLDAFMQLFPDLEPFSGQRYRASDAWMKIGDAVNEIRGSTDMSRMYAVATGGDVMEETQIFRYWAYWHFRKADGTNFASWDEFNGPLDLNSDKLTLTMRYNYSNNDRVSILPDGFNFVNGSRPTVFQASNVVMFTDALCGSSCASFHEELKNIAGVKSVTVGGRPEKKPIQAITGSKGGEVIPLITFPLYAGYILNISRPLGMASVKSDDATLSGIANTPQISIRVGDGSSRAQSQDQIRKGDKSATPLQFIYEAADCRIFYTADSYADPDLAWKQVWDAHSDNTKCVEGSTGHKSSISGGFKPFGATDLTADDQPDAPAGGGGDDDDSAAAHVRGSGVIVLSVVAFVAAAMM